MRRTLLARGVGQLVPADRCQVQAEIAENVEGLVKALAGIALVSKRTKARPSSRICAFRLIANADESAPIVLREVELSSSAVFSSTNAVRIQRRTLRRACSSPARSYARQPRAPDEPPGLDRALALHVDEPDGSVTKSSRRSSQVERVIWISSGYPCDSMRLAMFTVSPQRS